MKIEIPFVKAGGIFFAQSQTGIYSKVCLTNRLKYVLLSKLTDQLL